MNISKASEISGVSAKMIRYYEQIGLTPPARRNASGYRVYTQKDLHTLLFIRRARDLGFALAEISDLLNLWQDDSRHSADVKKLAQAHITQLEERIQSLQQMSQVLQALIQCCAGDDRPDCPILENLEQMDNETLQKSQP